MFFREKIVRVPPGYGHYNEGHYFNSAVYKKIWERAGFTIKEGRPDLKNKRELGITPPMPLTNDKWNARLAQEAKASTPQAFTNPLDILNSSIPLVAKADWLHEGSGKYLLVTREDKAQFLTAALSPDITENDVDLDDTATRDLLERRKANILAGDFTDPSLEKALTHFTAQEYIETPGNRHTSFRIVADATGHIHSILLLYSSHRKGEKTSQEDLEGVNKLFRDPQSPLYINTPDIVSNVAQNGGQINLLSGKKITDPVEIQILLDLGFNVHKPRLPRRVLKLASKIAKAGRFGFPYLGMDFIKSGTGKNARYLFLEANAGPHVDAKDIKVNPEKYPTPFDVETLLMRRVSRRAQRRLWLHAGF